MKKIMLLTLSSLIVFGAFAQEKVYEVKGAQKKDTNSPESIVSAVYDVISGEAGVKRDWNRFKSLWYPGANLTMVTPIGKKQAKQITMGLDEFIKLSSNHSKLNSFYEVEIFNKKDKIGHIAHVTSTYVIKSDPKAADYDVRGVNLFQLYFDGDRWWILNCIWENEIMGMQIPSEYLSN
ncbi:MAG: hypothetical protein ACPGLV_18760 [Bacteroidia bacterium]